MSGGESANIVIDNYAANWDSYVSSANDYFSQSFAVTTSINVTSVELPAGAKLNNPAFNFRASIYNAVSNLPTTKIVDSLNTINSVLYCGAGTTNVFNFDTTLLTSGNYCIVISYENVTLHNASNYVSINIDNSNAFTDGIMGYILPPAGWTTLAGYDLCITIVATTETQPATEYISGKSGFTLSYQTAGDDYLTTSIVASSVELPIHLRDNNRTAIESFLSDLVSSDEDRFMVLIYENGLIHWRGKIQVERVQIPDRFYTEISIFAADGLGRLDSIPYDNAGTLYTGWETMHNHLHNIISKLGIYPTFTDLQLAYCQDWAFDEMVDAMHKVVRFQHDAFKEAKGDTILPFDCLTVLKQILLRFNLRIIQRSGIFFIESVNYLLENTEVTTYYYYADGTLYDLFVEYSDVAITQKLADGLQFFREPAKYARVQYAYKDSIAGSNLFTDLVPIDTAWSDGEIPAGNGEVLALGFDYLINNVAELTLVKYYVKFIYTIKIGANYLSNASGSYVWSTDSSNRVVMYSREIRSNANTTFTETIGFICAEAPVAGDFDFYWTLDFVDVDDNPVIFVPDVTLLSNVALIIYAVGDENNGTKSVTATTGNISGEKIEPDVLVIGDKPYLRSVGRMQGFNGTVWANTFDNWGVSVSESLNIDQLLAREIMALQVKAVMMTALKLYQDIDVSKKIGGNVIMTAAYIANANSWSVECFTTEVQRTGIAFSTFVEVDETGGLPGGIITPPPTASPNFWGRSSNLLQPLEAGDKVNVSIAESGETAIVGQNTTGGGVQGVTTDGGTAVSGNATGGGTAVFGQSDTGFGGEFSSTKITGNQTAGLVIVDADITLTTQFTILCDTTTADVIVTIPDATALIGMIYRIRRWAGTNDVIVTPSGYNSIIGSLASYATLTLTANGQWIEIMSDGTDWYIVQDNPIY